MAMPEGSLNDFFKAGKGSGYTYTDGDCLDISSHLDADGYAEWAKIPRIYIVLRLLDKVDAMDDFVRLGISDLCLPFQRVSQLPKSLGSFRETFIERQTSVLTTAIALEKGLARQNHVHVQDDAVFPYESLGLLGRGRYEVDQVRSPLSGEVFARKIFKRLGVSRKIQQEFLNELNVMKRIDHEHCIQLVASYTDRRNFGILMSPVAECNLTEFFGRAERHQTHRATLSTFFGCLAAAVKYLHESKIRHRDIKPDNILIKGARIYLADFGISLDWEHLSRSTTTEESGRTLAYCAPEVAAQFQKRSSATDIWSLGCVFMEMLVIRHGFAVEQLKSAFRDNSESRTFHQNSIVVYTWLNEKLQEPRPMGVGRSISQLTMAMLSRTPTERPSADAVYHIISQFQARDPNSENPYCGQCCAADFETDIAHAKSSMIDPTIQEGSVAPSTLARHVLRSRHETTSDPHISSPSPRSSASQQSLEELRARSTEAFSSVSLTSQSDQKTFIPVEATLTLDRGTDQMEGPTAIPSRELVTESGSRTTSDMIQFRRPINVPLFESLSFQQWPVVNLEGRLPRLSSIDWRHPHALISAIRKDRVFMKFLLRAHSDLHTRIVQLQETDYLALVHLLLYNGLDIDEMRKTTPAGDGSATPIMAIILNQSTGWSSQGTRLSMIRLVVAFWGLNHESHLATRYVNDNPNIVSSAPLLHESAYRRGPLAVALRLQLEVFEALLDAGANPNEQYVFLGRGYEPQLWNVLELACDLGNLNAVKALDRANVSHEPTQDGLSALNIAVKRGHEKIVSYLLSTGRYTRSKPESDRETELFRAASNGYVGVVRGLLKNGANARAILDLERGPTEPLIEAAVNNKLAVVKVLMEEAGVDPDAHPPGGRRALAYMDHVSKESEVGKYLISEGAKPPTVLERARRIFDPKLGRPAPRHVSPLPSMVAKQSQSGRVWAEYR